MNDLSFEINDRKIGSTHKPFIIAEIGINHGGNMDKAKRMIDDAKAAGCECVKMQYHIPHEEMVKNDVIPGNASESIWDIICDSCLTHEQHVELKAYIESKDLIYLSTPFSIPAADRLHEMGVQFFKIGSGECNNYPLIEHVAQFGKPMIVSTGMNDLNSIRPVVDIITAHKVPFALLHCTSIYPTPYPLVKLPCIQVLQKEFPTAIVGLSDHSMGNYTSFGAVALGASIIEKHFTSTHEWEGPDIALSLTPSELSDLIKGCEAVYESCLNSQKDVLAEESPTIQFAYSSAVSTRVIEPGEKIDESNVTFKRPGTGDFLAKDWQTIFGKSAQKQIEPNSLLTVDMVD